MKSIKLTKEQKNKLLEMCTKLYPKVKWHFWRDDSCPEFDETHLGYNMQYTLGNKAQPYKYGLVIHWFETCMINLCEKIIKDNDQLSDFKSLNFNKKHPIDYLYEEFKKLK